MALARKSLKPTTCAVCRHPERERIEGLLASGVSLRSLAKKFEIGKDSLARHWARHVAKETKVGYLAGKATIAELRERAAEEGASILEYLGVVRSILMGAITASAEAGDGYRLATLSGRVVEVLREIGKLTGEIERLNPRVTVNNTVAIFASPQFIALQSGLIQIARNHPAARQEIVAMLRDLDARPVAPKLNGAHPPVVIEGEAVHAA